MVELLVQFGKCLFFRLIVDWPWTSQYALVLRELEGFTNIKEDFVSLLACISWADMPTSKQQFLLMLQLVSKSFFITTSRPTHLAPSDWFTQHHNPSRFIFSLNRLLPDLHSIENSFNLVHRESQQSTPAHGWDGVDPHSEFGDDSEITSSTSDSEE